MITLKRLSKHQLEAFAGTSAVINHNWVLINPLHASLIISELLALNYDQRTCMKCIRRIKQATGEVIEIHKRRQPPAPKSGYLKIKTSKQGKSVLNFIEAHFVHACIDNHAQAYSFIKHADIGRVLNVLKDMLAHSLSMRTVRTLINQLESYTPPAVQPFTVPLVEPEAVEAVDEWIDDEAFEQSYDEAYKQAHDKTVVSLPLSKKYWGAVYPRACALLADYNYAPANDVVSLQRKHVAGLLKQLQLVSIHGHQGLYIDYAYETELDDELEKWSNLK
jgi:hypothetical protein